jgi:small subunit ribosomal protein S8
MTNDLVSDMLTRVRNATLARHSFTRVQYSKLTLAILKVLAAEGYITSYAVEQGLAQLELKYY